MKKKEYMRIIERYSKSLDCEISKKTDPLCFAYISNQYTKGKANKEDLVELKGYYSGLKTAREMFQRILCEYMEHIENGVLEDNGREFENFIRKLIKE